jgi:hypothetical protein
VASTTAVKREWVSAASSTSRVFSLALALDAAMSFAPFAVTAAAPMLFSLVL